MGFLCNIGMVLFVLLCRYGNIGKSIFVVGERYLASFPMVSNSSAGVLVVKQRRNFFHIFHAAVGGLSWYGHSSVDCDNCQSSGDVLSLLSLPLSAI